MKKNAKKQQSHQALRQHFTERVNQTLDKGREQAIEKRHLQGHRSARENLQALVDDGSFSEYGQMAVAAQRGRREFADLKVNTAADGVITGTATINANLFNKEKSQVAVVINDYTVLAGTQGYFHHKKIDRMLNVALERKLPMIMFTEGGGGRPGDTDVTTMIAGLNIKTWVYWSNLAEFAPRIAIAHGYNFAGNAALFGGADIRIATKKSWIGMAGPAMIEGGGLGRFAATEIGPALQQFKNGVVDILVEDEEQATQISQKLLAYFQGKVSDWQSQDQTSLWDLLPEDRRFTYDVRKIINTLADQDSFIELRQAYASGIITGFVRIGGVALGLICNDCKVLGGAIDANAAEKAADFIDLCNLRKVPLLSLCDTPGFMVGPDSESQAAVRKMSAMFNAGARMKMPIITLFLRKAYGLGAMAMAGGSFAKSIYTAAWPMAEFGGMGLEGAVNLGFKKELSAIEDEQARKALFDKLVAQLYEQGKAEEAAAFLEIDAVIDPSASREKILQALSE